MKFLSLGNFASFCPERYVEKQSTLLLSDFDESLDIFFLFFFVFFVVLTFIVLLYFVVSLSYHI